VIAARQPTGHDHGRAPDLIAEPIQVLFLDVDGVLADGGIWLAVRAGITGTRCGLRVDGDGRLLQPAPRRLGRASGPPVPIPHAFAAGIDAADPGMGGIASGLALALVLGRRAGSLAAEH
jgi:hypothetical protein